MQFLYRDSFNGRNKTVVMEHNGEELEWGIEKYRNFISNEIVFGDINKCLSLLSKTSQDNVWAAYKQIHHDILTVSNLARLDRKISDALVLIENELSYAFVHEQLIADGTMWLPPDPDEQLNESETDLKSFNVTEVEDVKPVEDPKELARKLTYSRRDYYHLNTLLVYMKLYLPVLSQYNQSITNDVEGLFLCMRTIGLLEKLQLMRDDGYVRLRNYVIHYWTGRTSKEPVNPSVLMLGLSQESVTDWILAELIFKKILPTGVSHRYQNLSDDERPNIIKELFYTVSTYAGTIVKGPNMEYFRDKGFPKNDMGDEDQTARLENTKVVGDVDENNIIINEVFLEDINNLLNHVDQTLPKSLIDDVIFDKHNHTTHHPFRMNMMKWVLGRYISPEMIRYLDVTKPGYKNCFITTYALLVHWGYKDIADIIDGNIDLSVERELAFNNLDITADQVRDMQRFYPHEIESNRAKSESKRNANYAIIACAEMQDYVRGLTFVGTNRPGHWKCYVDVMYRLVELLTMMNNKGFI